jgi:hypothetical protein
MIFAAMLLIFGAFGFWSFTRPSKGTVANIYVNGECVRSVDLSLVTESFEFTVETSAGTNVIQVEPGRIRVKEADCPDQVCVHAGWIADSANPVVCLPHRLVIRLEKNGKSADGPDAVSK